MKQTQIFSARESLDSQSKARAYPQLTLETISDLELIMTNSAIGYIYALNALNKEKDKMSINAERMRSEIDGHKDSYFKARSKLVLLDLDRLLKMELGLKMQKQIIFSEQHFLH